MKRMLLAAATSTIVALAAPGMASAHKAKCHGRSHHACTHVRNAHHARVLSFGTALSPTGSAPTGTTPTAPGGEAGKVASFEGGVLVITLNDGSTVSGKVTEQTELRCESATAAEGNQGDDNSDGNGDENSGGNGDDSTHSGPGMSSTGDDMSSGGDGEDGPAPTTCTTAALVKGAVVREAELSVSSAGSVWEHIDLIQ
ncbi:MAG TPA: hypothetical protein VGN13_00690 [Solirubrobacteraceae bacterium]|jgi:hypothetical protein